MVSVSDFASARGNGGGGQIILLHECSFATTKSALTEVKSLQWGIIAR